MNTDEFILIDRETVREAGLPFTGKKDASLAYCTQHNIPVAAVVPRGKGQTALVKRTDWDLHVLRTTRPGPVAAATEDYAAILRRLARVEELLELILKSLTDPK